jgi:hypothetical protein
MRTDRRSRTFSIDYTPSYPGHSVGYNLVFRIGSRKRRSFTTSCLARWCPLACNARRKTCFANPFSRRRFALIAQPSFDTFRRYIPDALHGNENIHFAAFVLSCHALSFHCNCFFVVISACIVLQEGWADASYRCRVGTTEKVYNRSWAWDPSTRQTRRNKKCE